MRNGDFSGLRIGDVICYTWNKGNPFDQEEKFYYKIIDIRDGYVQYVDTVTGDTMSCTVRIFLGIAKRLGP